MTSALVTPSSARSLLHAMQTAPDTRAFRLPNAAEREFSSTVAGFELTGWLQEPGYAEGLDSKDPFAGGMHYPPQRPSTDLPALAKLSPDADMRLWRNEDGHVVLVSRVWDKSDGGKSSHGSGGHQLLIDRSNLSVLLRRLDRWLIAEVQIEHYVDDSSEYRSYGISGNEDNSPPYQEPYTQYFLVDFAGEIHDK